MSGTAGGYTMIGVLWGMGILVTILGARSPRSPRPVVLLALAALAGSTTLAGLLWNSIPSATFAGGGMRLDGFASFVQVFVLLGALCALLLGNHAQHRWRTGSSGLILLSAAGASLLVMAWDLMGVMVGFIGALIPLWGLSALYAGESGREGALKGMVIGVLGTALIGLGSALMLARTGTTHFLGIRIYLSNADWIGSDPLLVAALALVLAGVGCMIAAVPFHMWFVDVVEALPIPGSLLLSGGILAAGLAAICRMLLVGFEPVADSGPGYLSWTSVLHGVGIAALVVCNAMALVQRRLKRMIGYLAAGQAGLVLVTLAAVGGIDQPAVNRALGGILVFLAVFAVNWVGLFVAVSAVEDGQGNDPKIGRLRGLAKDHPWLTVAVGLALLCMAGMPLTAGFFSRLYLLETLVEAGWTGTAVVAALSLGLVLVMSLGLVAAMVMRPGKAGTEVRVTGPLTLVAILVSVTILLFGILPEGILDIAIRSAGSLMTW
ncbi:MAG: hypothetical protein JRJ87_17850 [Deltaproteobacteria bacterium]|nr:hypothetical protein [Deltaproteobacteria bacterium]